MKIDKSIWDSFSSIGNKNSQPQANDAINKSESATESSQVGDLSGLPVSTSTESDAAVKLSGADEVEVKSFMQSVNGTPEEKMAVVRMAQNKGVALTRGNLTALQRALSEVNPSATLEEGLKGVEASGGENELKQLVTQLQNLLKGTGNISLQQVQGGMTLVNISETGEGAVAQSFLLDRFSAKELMVILAAVVKGNLPADVAQKVLNGTITAEELNLLELKQIGGDGSGTVGSALADALVDLKASKWTSGDGKTLAELWVNHASRKDNGQKTAVAAEAAKATELKNTLLQEATATPVEVAGKISDSVKWNDSEGIEDEASAMEAERFMNDMMQGLEQSISAMVENLQKGGTVMDQATSATIRQVLRVEVTERMVEAKSAFKTMKTELTQQLQKLETPQSTEDQKRLLKAVVEKLDNFIMKSDAMMYTSMKNERDLLKTSSTLQDALKLLSKGKSDEAFALTKKAMNDLERLVFKPSSKRVEAHLTGKLSDWREVGLHEEGEPENPPKTRLQKALGSAYAATQQGESSGRLLMEMMRKLGLNNEFEHSEEILKSVSKKDHDGQARLDDNVKAVLMKMAEDQGADAKIEPVQKALESLLGTQLMNRHEVGKDEQTMMFVVPWGPQADQSVKVMVNGRKNGGVMSWENCSLYFSFNTKRLGQTGIRVTISDKTVSMAVFNDRDESKKVLDGYLDHLYQGFVEVGFQKGNVGYSKFGFSEDKKGDPSEIRQFSEAMKAMAPPQQGGKASVPVSKVASTENPSRGFELKI